MEQGNDISTQEIVDSSAALAVDSVKVSSSDHSIWPPVSELDFYLEIHRLQESIDALEQSAPSLWLSVILTLFGALFGVILGMWVQHQKDTKERRIKDADILAIWGDSLCKSFNLYLLNKDSKEWNAKPSFVKMQIEYENTRLRVTGDSTVNGNGSIEGIINLRGPQFKFGSGSFFHDVLKNGKPLLGNVTIYMINGKIFSDHEPYSTNSQKYVHDRYKWVESKPWNNSDNRENSNANDVFMES